MVQADSGDAGHLSRDEGSQVTQPVLPEEWLLVP